MDPPKPCAYRAGCGAGMSTKIRPAIIDDLKAVQDLNHELFVFDIKSDPLLNINWPYETEGESYFSTDDKRR